MEGPVLTESEVWKVDDRKNDYSPLEDDSDENFSKESPLTSENPAIGTESTEENSPDLIEHDLRSEADSIGDGASKGEKSPPSHSLENNQEESKHEKNEIMKGNNKQNEPETRHDINQDEKQNDCQEETRVEDKQEINKENEPESSQKCEEKQGMKKEENQEVKEQENIHTEDIRDNSMVNREQNEQDINRANDQEIIQGCSLEHKLDKEDKVDVKQEIKQDNRQTKKEGNRVEMNQEITILVTSHDCGTEDEEDEKQSLEETESEPVLSSEVEEENLDGSIVVASLIEVSEIQKTNLIDRASTESETNNNEVDFKTETNSESTDLSVTQKTEASTMHAKTQPSVSKLKDSPEVTPKKSQTTKPQETLTLSRSPGRTQTVQTQVSLEVMYSSVATSPMTPPEGSTGFVFPSTFGKFASKPVTETIKTKDAEMQAILQPEFRSVATAPMTPLVLTAPELIPEPEPRIGVSTEEKPEPVQEVSWDEKGMTWEVYGAAVEVAVLGTAIQKHLEKQVKKKKPAPLEVHPEMPEETSPPMPSSPPPVIEISENIPEKTEETIEESVRPRENRFRRWFRNILIPRCCSRARQDQDD